MRKILIVDDDAEYVEFLEEMLTEANYDVTGITSGVDALKLLKKLKFDLVILDVVMPDVNGFQVCQEIRKMKRNHDAMIVMVTGKRMSSDDLIQGLELGADEYLMKPVSIGELLARVKAMLRIRDLKDEILRKVRKEAWIKGMSQVLATLGQYLAESSTSIASFSEYADLKSEKRYKAFQKMITNKTQVISLVLETLQDVIKKLEAERTDISEAKILNIESELKEKLLAIQSK